MLKVKQFDDFEEDYKSSGKSNPFFNYIQDNVDTVFNDCIKTIPEKIPYYLRTIDKKELKFVLVRLSMYLVLADKPSGISISKYMIKWEPEYKAYTGFEISEHKISFITSMLNRMDLINKQLKYLAEKKSKNIFSFGVNNPCHPNNRNKIKQIGESNFA